MIYYMPKLIVHNESDSESKVHITKYLHKEVGEFILELNSIPECSRT